MKLLFKYLVRYRRMVLIALFLAAIDQIFINLNPYILGNYLIDPYANKAQYFRQNGLDKIFFSGVFRGILMIVGVSTVAWIAKGYQNYILNTVIRRFGADLYADVQKHTLSLPFQDFENERSGEVLSMLQKVRSDSEQFITKFVNVLFASSIALGVVVVISYQLSPLLPAVYISGAILLSVATSLLSRKIKKIQHDILQGTNSLAGSTTESLRNMELIKSLGLVQQEIKRLNKLNFKILADEIRKIKKIRTVGFIYGAFIQTLHQVVMLLLMIFLFYDRMSVGQLVMMQIYFYFVFGTLGEISSAIVSFHEAKASLTNLEDLLDKPVEYHSVRPQLIGPLKNIRFDNISFRYNTSVVNALTEISFEACIGETVAFVGPSGSGKTTLVKLLTGLYIPDGGDIMFNGLSHHDFDFDELRHQLGLVTQEAYLFSGTIKENLLFVNQNVSDAAIAEVMRKVACQHLLVRAPGDIETMIGEGGLKLSGGEKQRLSIARALIKDSRLLVFDEATSALDSLTEREIAETIHNVTADRKYISIMIAHRLSTIMFADKIYVLEKGRIVECGTHKSLINQNGLYNAMWREQIGEIQKPAEYIKT